jgi:hypothetical protein
MPPSVVLFHCSDGKLAVPRELAVLCGTVAGALESPGADLEEVPDIPLSDILSMETAQQLVAFLGHLSAAPSRSDTPRPPPRDDLPWTFPEFETCFVTALAPEQLVCLMAAADFLVLPPLFGLCGMALANLLRCKSRQEICAEHGLDVEAFTPQEEGRVRTKHRWIEEELPQ